MQRERIPWYRQGVQVAGGPGNVGTTQGPDECVRSGDGPKWVGGEAEYMSRGEGAGALQSGLGERDGRAALSSRRIHRQVTTLSVDRRGVVGRMCVGG